MPSPSRNDSTDEATDKTIIVGRLAARLLGLPLLTVDVHIAVGPDASLPAPVRLAARVRRPTWRRAARRRFLPPRMAGGRRAIDAGRSRPTPDGRLARSAQLVREATTVLEEVGTG